MQNLRSTDNRALLLHHLDSVRKLTGGVAGPQLSQLLGTGDDKG